MPPDARLSALEMVRFWFVVGMLACAVVGVLHLTGKGRGDG